jgi:cytochrome c oxidase subunit 1
MLIFLFNLIRSVRNGERAPANPWHAPTLEWSIPSPPPHYNFRTVPEVRARDPLWGPGGNEIDPEHTGDPEPVMPSPSAWPITLAFALLLGAIGGLMTSLPIVLAGVALIFISVYGWAFQPLER